ncbi:hypothetical protein [Consotaella aegiceratis]|uniref:hypothetical protein n=1 Tax=Consotaella aegiceratis TaxID=3097961 RepID=UPI002F402A42
MFDEVLSNPERGRLCFHDRDGHAIGFDRPFNWTPRKTSRGWAFHDSIGLDGIRRHRCAGSRGSGMLTSDMSG